jgi:hypothetical protein
MISGFVVSMDILNEFSGERFGELRVLSVSLCCWCSAILIVLEDEPQRNPMGISQ